MGFGQNLWYTLTAMGGPGDHPGMARKAAAGPMDAGSDVVATTSTTIFSSSDSNTPAAPPNTYTTSTWESTLDYCGASAPQHASRGPANTSTTRISWTRCAFRNCGSDRFGVPSETAGLIVLVCLQKLRADGKSGGNSSRYDRICGLCLKARGAEKKIGETKLNRFSIEVFSVLYMYT
jgi:hypothetical protein